MTKSNGIKSLKQAAKLLNKHSPDGESLAYINPEEAKLLRSHGGSGIMTLQGVPSYWKLPDWVPFGKTISKVGTKITDFLGYSGDKSKPVYDDKGRQVNAPRSFVNDALSIWAGLRAKKDKEGLNAAEMEQFNKLNQQLAAAETEFDVGTDFGTQLTAPEYETDVTEVAAYKPIDFSGQSTPDLTTTAVAQGGRIGAFNGGIQGLMPQQGFMPQPGLDPRMGYALGEVVEDQTSIFNTPNGEVVTDQRQEIEGQEAKLVGPALIQYRNLQKKVKGYVDGIGWVYGEPTEKEKRMYERLKNMMEEEEIYSMPILDAAYGGRIGAQSGGIMPLLNMGGMEKDYRQDGGFVPIGRKEKADDVPARLSKNEFVFTADAVRAAGGGNIDQGAQRMYNVMKNLEAGGEISEQSQGKA